MNLSEVIRRASVTPVHHEGDVEVLGLSAHSKQVRPGDAFVAMPSRSSDTHERIPEAIANGAVAIIGHKPSPGFGVPWVQLRHDPESLDPIWSSKHQHTFLKDLAHLCREFYGDPTQSMRVIGVTGTNGKTTVAWMLRQALQQLGAPTAYLGTLGAVTQSQWDELGNTTLFPVELWREIARFSRSGITHLVMEVSSHALAQHRVEGVRFDAGVFTNLSQDHLDYHVTMEDYAAAKGLLFTEYAEKSEKNFVAVLNEDDPTSLQWAQDFLTRDARAAGASTGSPIGALIAYAMVKGTYEPRVFTYGETSGHLRVRTIDLGLSHISFEATHDGKTEVFEVPIGGNFNAENIRATIACLLSMGYEFKDAIGALAAVTSVPGRFETFQGRGLTVIVDYAHTPDALYKLLEGVGALTTGRVISVFGCGGDRDRTKRPIMARMSGELAALTILTSDNPRTEDPEQIFSDLIAGLPSGCQWERVDDRRRAIQRAVALARPGDSVVISGKGHENYQIFGREKVHFDDREEARAALGSQS